MKKCHHPFIHHPFLPILSGLGGGRGTNLLIGVLSLSIFLQCCSRTRYKSLYLSIEIFAYETVCELFCLFFGKGVEYIFDKRRERVWFQSLLGYYLIFYVANRYV